MVDTSFDPLVDWDVVKLAEIRDRQIRRRSWVIMSLRGEERCRCDNEVLHFSVRWVAGLLAGLILSIRY